MVSLNTAHTSPPIPEAGKYLISKETIDAVNQLLPLLVEIEEFIIPEARKYYWLALRLYKDVANVLGKTIGKPEMETLLSKLLSANSLLGYSIERTVEPHIQHPAPPLVFEVSVPKPIPRQLLELVLNLLVSEALDVVKHVKTGVASKLYLVLPDRSLLTAIKYILDDPDIIDAGLRDTYTILRDIKQIQGDIIVARNIYDILVDSYSIRFANYQFTNMSADTVRKIAEKHALNLVEKQDLVTAEKIYSENKSTKGIYKLHIGCHKPKGLGQLVFMYELPLTSGDRIEFLPPYINKRVKYGNITVTPLNLSKLNNAEFIEEIREEGDRKLLDISKYIELLGVRDTRKARVILDVQNGEIKIRFH